MALFRWDDASQQGTTTRRRKFEIQSSIRSANAIFCDRSFNFSRDAGDMVFALEYAEQLARILPDETLRTSLRAFGARTKSQKPNEVTPRTARHDDNRNATEVSRTNIF